MVDTDAIADALWDTLRTQGLPGMELEFRLGHALAGPARHFSPNVGAARWTALRERLARRYACTYIETVEHTDAAGVRHVRTVAFGDAPPPPPFCMTKTKTFQLDAAAPDGGPYTVRCSIAMERVVPDRAVRPPTVMRHKRRWRYACGAWAFDLTDVRSNADLDAEEVYEAELELTDPGVLYEQPLTGVVRLGVDLLGELLAV